MVLSYKTAPVVAEYGGEIYYFFAELCHEQFMADPETYLTKPRPS